MQNNTITNRSHECGGTFVEHVEPVTLSLRGRDVTVDERFLRCDKCGDERVTWESAGEMQRAAAAKLQEENGSLTPAEIRAFRESFGLTQAQAEQAIGVAKKTFARWENGSVFPNRATDNLLRLILRDPAALWYLAERNGVTVPHPVPHSRSIRLSERLFSNVEKAANSQGVSVDVFVNSAMTEVILGNDVCNRIESLITNWLGEWEIRQRPQPTLEPWQIAHRDIYDKAI